MIKKKVLLTGASGFLGRAVLHELIKKNFVIATDSSGDVECENCKFIKADIFEDDFWRHLEPQNFPDVIVHLAWRDGFIHGSKEHMKNLSDHYKFLTNSIDFGVKQIVVAGSIHEVGFWEGKVDENTPEKPQTEYGISKLALKNSVMLYAVKNNVIFQWIRMFYIISDGYAGSSVFKKIREMSELGRGSFPFTRGENKYDFIDIKTLAKQISNVTNQTKVSGVIHCCSGKPRKIRDVIDEFVKLHKLSIKINYGELPDRSYDSREIWGDIEKYKKVIDLDHDI